MEYSEKNMSIISATFYGIIRSTMECNNCHKIKYSFVFSFLTLRVRGANGMQEGSILAGLVLARAGTG